MTRVFQIFALLLSLNSAWGLYSSSDDVVELTEANFDRLVLQSDAIWIVEFYAPWCGHCKSLSPEYKKAATALKGVIKVGAINADDNKNIGGQYGVRGFPTIKVFGTNKKSPTEFSGQRTAQGIVDAGLEEAKKKAQASLGGGGSKSSGGSSGSSDVVELTDANFDKLVLNSDDVWLVEFFAPWCGHCKSLAPHWEKAATELKGKVKLGALDATVHQAKAQEYGIQGYPSIKFFPGGKKQSDSAEDYQGGRTSSDIVAWALEKYTEVIPAPEVLELTSEETEKAACEGKPLCVITILPHILDCNAKCRNDYLKILKVMAEKYKQKMWGWIWAEGGQQPQIEEALDIGGFGYPAMALVNFKKMKFSLLRGSFSNEGINEFLRDIAYGRGQTSTIRGEKIPKIHETEAWDGKDGQLPEEEDIDLSDIDLDEKDEL